MTYFLNLSLPLYFMLLPLGIAALLAAKLYQWQSIFSKVKANYQAQLREAQNRLDEAMQKASDDIDKFALDNRDRCAKDAEIINKLKSEAVEREAHIQSLNRQIERKRLEIKDNELAVEQLKSKLRLSELAHIETQTDLDGERYYLDAVAEAYKILYDIVKRNSRTRKQYEGVMKSIGEKRAFAMGNLNRSVLGLADKNAKQKAQTKTIIDDGKIDGIVHDALGVARVFQADQSESVNNRHTVVNICNEVNRGIAEQAERIRQELEVVDMSQLESGDSVKLRNGSVYLVDAFDFEKSTRDYPYWVEFNGGGSVIYTISGNYWVSKNEHDLDIAQIIKPAKHEAKFEPQVDEPVYSENGKRLLVVSIGKESYFLSDGIPHEKCDVYPINEHQYKNGFCTKS